MHPPPQEVPEGEATMLVDSGGAAEVVGALLARLAQLQGGEAAAAAWQAAGEQPQAFLPPPDRGDAAALSKAFAALGL